MQATAISNSSTANAPNAAQAGAPALPFDPQSTSPFTAVFQAALKGSMNTARTPAPGKAQDSSRAPGNSAGTGSGDAKEAGKNSHGPMRSGSAAPVHPANLVPHSLSVPASQYSIISPGQISGSTEKTAAPMIPLFFGQGAVAVGNSPLEIFAGQNQPGFAGSSLPPSMAGPSGDTPGPTLLTQGPDAAATVAARNFNSLAAGNSSSSIYGDAAANALLSASQGIAPPQSNSSGTGIAAKLPLASISAADPSNALLPADAEQATPLARVVDPKAGQQDPSSSLVQTGFVNKLFENLAQPNITGAVAQPSPQNNPPVGANPSSDKAAQAARADLNFLNLQTLNLAGASAKAALPVSAQPASNPEARSNSLAPAGTSLSLAETLQQSASKLAAVGAPALRFLNTMKSQSDSPASAAAVSVVSQKAQTQSSSNGSTGSDSYSKPDRASNGANAQAEGKGFVQTMDAAAGSAAMGRASVADPAVAAAAAVSVTVPVQPQTAGPSTQHSAPANIDSHPAQVLPPPSEGAAVVNSAHILTQSGQTEIRIEMQADSLGGVELRAHIAGDQIGASISVEHHDAQVALISDLPALHSALAEKNLRLETFTVSQGSFSSLNSGLGQDAGQRGLGQQQQQHSPSRFAYLEQPEILQQFVETSAGYTGPAMPGSGLSVVG